MQKTILGPADADDRATSVRSAARILELVEWLAVQSGPVSLTDASAALGLPKSSVRLLLATLVEGRYATRDNEGGHQLRRLPGEARGGAVWPALIRLASPVVHELVATLRESGFIGVLVGSRIRYLVKVLPDREVVYNRNIDVERIPHQTASGLAILSALPADELDSYLDGYLESIRDPEFVAIHGTATELRATLAEARARGVASNMRGIFDGAAGAAAPVFDHTGRPVGALNISGPAQRVIDNRQAIERAVAEAARRVSAAMANIGRIDGRRTS